MLHEQIGSTHPPPSTNRHFLRFSPSYQLSTLPNHPESLRDAEVEKTTYYIPGNLNLEERKQHGLIHLDAAKRRSQRRYLLRCPLASVRFLAAHEEIDASPYAPTTDSTPIHDGGHRGTNAVGYLGFHKLRGPT